MLFRLKKSFKFDQISIHFFPDFCQLQMENPSPFHKMFNVLPNTSYQKRKLQTSIPNEHRCKNLQQNLSELNSKNTFKGLLITIKWNLSQGCKVIQYLLANQHDNHIKKMKDKKHLTKLFMIKNSQQRGCRGNIPQDNEGHI